MMTLIHFPSSTPEIASHANAEDRIARLADAAYQAALRQGLVGSFVDVELGIWTAIRRVVEAELSFDEDFRHDRHAARRFPARLAGVG